MCNKICAISRCRADAVSAVCPGQGWCTAGWDGLASPAPAAGPRIPTCPHSLCPHFSEPLRKPPPPQSPCTAAPLLSPSSSSADKWLRDSELKSARPGSLCLREMGLLTALGQAKKAFVSLRFLTFAAPWQRSGWERSSTAQRALPAVLPTPPLAAQASQLVSY